MANNRKCTGSSSWKQGRPLLSRWLCTESSPIPAGNSSKSSLLFCILPEWSFPVCLGNLPRCYYISSEFIVSNGLMIFWLKDQDCVSLFLESQMVLVPYLWESILSTIFLSHRGHAWSLVALSYSVKARLQRTLTKKSLSLICNDQLQWVCYKLPHFPFSKS